MATQEATVTARTEVAKALKRYMARNGMKVREFNEKVLGVKPGNVTAYGWISGRGLPSKQYIPLLAKALHKPAAFFEPRSAVVEQSNGADSKIVEVVGDFADRFVAAVRHEETAPPIVTETPIAVDAPVIVHARNPRTIARERASRAVMGTVADTLEGRAQNSLTYWSNGDSTATVTMVYNADRKTAQKIFRKLSEMGVDIQKKVDKMNHQGS